jgi:general secretion pathway protein G
MNKLKRFIINITLKEIISYVGVLLLVIVVVVPLCMKHTIKKKTNAAKLKISLIEQGINSYRTDTGDFPNTLDELIINKRKMKTWKGPYIKPEHLLDPWGHSFEYTTSELDFYVVCYGEDGIPNGTLRNKDITNRP